MGLGYNITAADPTTLSANLAPDPPGLQFSPGTASFWPVCALPDAGAACSRCRRAGRSGRHEADVRHRRPPARSFGVLGAIAPHVSVLIIARAGLGSPSPSLLGLSLAIINAVFPPAGRLPSRHTWAQGTLWRCSNRPSEGGWRATMVGGPASGHLVLAVLTLVITLKYVPETVRDKRKLDIPGILLIAAAPSRSSMG